MRRAAFLLSGLAVLAIALPANVLAQPAPKPEKKPEKVIVPMAPPVGDFWRHDEHKRVFGEPGIAPAPPLPPVKGR